MIDRKQIGELALEVKLLAARAEGESSSVLHRAGAAIEEMGEALSSPWRPIKSAPIDGTCFIVALLKDDDQGARVAWACGAFWKDEYWFDGVHRLVEPTH